MHTKIKEFDDGIDIKKQFVLFNVNWLEYWYKHDNHLRSYLQLYNKEKLLYRVYYSNIYVYY